MSSYIAHFVCEKCGKELAVISSSHKRPGYFVPQDIHEITIKAEWYYCDDCLNEDEREI